MCSLQNCTYDGIESWRKCTTKRLRDPCKSCTVDSVCTERDNNNSKLIQTFKTGMKNSPQVNNRYLLRAQIYCMSWLVILSTLINYQT